MNRGTSNIEHPMKEKKTENETLTPALSPFGEEREKRQPDAWRVADSR
jgi:hypothetical protein